MKKKLVISITILTVAGFVIVGIRACYLKDYVTVLNYEKEDSKIFISPDSITIASYLYVENSTTLGAVIDFESLKDSLFLRDLSVTVYSNDNPKQAITLKYVSAVVHPVTPDSGPYLDKIEANSFNDLPFSSRTITNSGLPYNKIGFYFRARQIGNTDFYNFKINGRLEYKGKVFYFEKDINTQRKVEYRPYRMMT